MDNVLYNLFMTDFSNSPGGWETALLALLIAFCIGHIVAWTYMLTHTGLSYSQMFAASLLVLPLIVATTMMLLAGNLLIALGLLSVFTMIRFRNVLKDTRDTAFVLWAVVAGVACGTQRFGIAIISGVAIALVFIYLRVTSFGGRHRYDVILSLEWEGNGSSVEPLRRVFKRHAIRAQLASQHDLEANKLDLSYRLLLRDPSRGRELLTELQAVHGVQRVSLFHRSDEAEV